MSRLNTHIQYNLKKLETLQTIRFSSGILFLFLLVLSGLQKWNYLTALSTLYWVLFFPILIRRVRKYQVYIKTLEQKKLFLERQNQKKNGILPRQEVTTTEQAKELLLVGPFSIFTFLNETWTQDGETLLKNKLEFQNITADELSLGEILKTQSHIQQLSVFYKVFEKNLFRYRALNQSGSTEDKIPKISLTDVQKELETVPYNSFITTAIVGALIWICCVAITILNEFGLVSPSLMNFWFLYLGVVIFAYQKNGSLFFKSLNLGRSVKVLKHLFRILDKNRASVFGEVVPYLSSSNLSEKFRKLEALIGLLSVETHILVNVIINILFPYYLIVGSMFIKRAKELQNNFSKIAQEVSYLDYLSCFVYQYKYHTRIFPQFQDKTEVIAEQMYLPLIANHKVIKNDVELLSSKTVHVLMGSNMSGKSTFLRTVGLNQTLALLGAPVFARSMKTFNGRVLSCILIEDSIEDSVSYFMKEVRRLRDIYKKAQSDKYLFLVDELFKGTNPKERLIAARSFLGEMSKLESIGVITTHDPELGFLEAKNKRFKSWHMEDHSLKEGPATSTNALVILKKEGLPVYEDS